MIITITGMSGSGKSTIARMVSEKLRYKRFSFGDFQRELAKEKGLTIKELGELEAKDPSLDKMVDEKQIKLGKQSDNFVIDSRLGAKFIPHAKKIFLDGDVDVRAKRIFGDKDNKSRMSSEKVESFEQTKNDMISRDKVDIERYKKYYKFDYTDKKHYDLIVDTTTKSPSQIVDEILKFLKKK